MKYETQGIRYCGSKKTIIPRILDLIPSGVKTVLDGCSGTTRVAQALKRAGYRVDCNDLAEYSVIFGQCYIRNNKTGYEGLIKHLNAIESIDGWITQNYAGYENGGVSLFGGKKKNWILKNAQKADGIREEIEKLSLPDKAVALTSLILALDKVSNNLGHQVSFLREWAPRCYDPLVLEVPNLISSVYDHRVFQQDVKTIEGYYDLVYLDPPYGTNNQKHKTTRVRYASYYNIWNSICKWDKPELFGASNRRKDSSDKLITGLSNFESTSYDFVRKEIELAVKSLKCKYLIFSYSNKSIVKIEDLIEMFSGMGKLRVESFDYKENVQKNLTTSKEFLGDGSLNKEYLFLLEKN